MGNLSPIGEAEKTRMEEITKRSVETFVKEFALAIPVAVLTVRVFFLLASFLIGSAGNWQSRARRLL